MTPAEFAEGQRLLAEATPGPWYWERGSDVLRTRVGSEGHRRGFGDFAFISFHDRVHPDVSDQAPSEADAALIVWLRNHADELLDAAGAA